MARATTRETISSLSWSLLIQVAKAEAEKHTALKKLSARYSIVVAGYCSRCESLVKDAWNRVLSGMSGMAKHSLQIKGRMFITLTYRKS